METLYMTSHTTFLHSNNSLCLLVAEKIFFQFSANQKQELLGMECNSNTSNSEPSISYRYSREVNVGKCNITTGLFGLDGMRKYYKGSDQFSNDHMTMRISLQIDPRVIRR